jgi:SAM-dependent methyltransferase
VETMPKLHIDISSSLYFCSLLSAFIPVKFYDYRPPKIVLQNLTSDFVDLLSLPFGDGTIKSLSCMHVVEHVGLGRYGDPLDPEGDLKAVAELTRVLSPGGSLLFVVPVGRPKIAFNAHRIYSYDQVVSYFSELTLQEFALIPDNPDDVGLVRQATRDFADMQNYGCGCFWFKKDTNDKAPEVL